MLDRKPHAAASAAVLAAIETSRCQGLLCATTITTIHYIAGRQIGNPASLVRIAELLSIFGIAPVNQAVLGSAIMRDMPDFEDAVLHDAALQAGANCIRASDSRCAHQLRASPPTTHHVHSARRNS